MFLLSQMGKMSNLLPGDGGRRSIVEIGRRVDARPGFTGLNESGGGGGGFRGNALIFQACAELWCDGFGHIWMLGRTGKDWDGWVAQSRLC